MAKVEFLYQQLYEKEKEKITSGKYSVGGKLPVESKLQEEYGVSMITVKKAMGMLAEEGLVRRVPGKGTFIQYVPQAENSSVSGRSDRMIGVVLEHAATPFALSMMYQLDHRAEKEGYKLCVRFSYGDRERETDEIRFLLSLGVKGLIIMPIHGRHYSPAILKLFIEGYPVILIDKKLNGIPLPSVRTDNAGAIAKMVNILADSGCKRISNLSSDDLETTSLKERQQGFIDEIKARRLSSVPVCYAPAKTTFTDNDPSPDTIDAIRHYLSANIGMLDAMVCMEYGLLPPLAIAAKSLGIILDRDVRVCVVDEDYLAPFGYTFMHMKQDEIAIADTAMDLLLRRIAGKTIDREDYLIPAIFHDRPHR